VLSEDGVALIRGTVFSSNIIEAVFTAHGIVGSLAVFKSFFILPQAWREHKMLLDTWKELANLSDTGLSFCYLSFPCYKKIGRFTCQIHMF
jgi:hypothetical protein